MRSCSSMPPLAARLQQRGGRCPRRGARAAATLGIGRRRPPAARAPACAAARSARARRAAPGRARRQRERMVGRRRPGSDETSRNTRARRRLLQRFQQRVGGVDVELVGLVDDDDAPAVLAGAVARGTTSAGAPRRPGCWPRSAWPSRRRAGADQQARMRQRAHLPRALVVSRDLEALPDGIALLRPRQHGGAKR